MGNTRQRRVPAQPDDLDWALMELLRRDGRRPANDLAKELEVSEATVRKRMNRLIERNLLRIVAVTNLQQMGYSREVLLQIKTQPGRTMEVARWMSRLPNIRHVAIGMGSFDLLVNAVFRGEGDIRDFVLNDLSACEGILSTESFHVFALVKRTFDWLGELEPEGVTAAAAESVELSPRMLDKRAVSA